MNAYPVFGYTDSRHLEFTRSGAWRQPLDKVPSSTLRVEEMRCFALECEAAIERPPSGCRLSDTNACDNLSIHLPSGTTTPAGQSNFGRYKLITKGFVAGDSLERAGWQREDAQESQRDAGRGGMGLCPVARGFSCGDAILKQHGESHVGLLTTSEGASGRALTPMTVDQPTVDWELYRRLKAEGRLNLLFHFSEAASAGLPCAETPTSRPSVLPFVSRAEHLAWRAQWRKGRWVKLSWTPEERAAILRQDAAYRLADERWKLNHGPVPGGASIIRWRLEVS